MSKLCCSNNFSQSKAFLMWLTVTVLIAQIATVSNMCSVDCLSRNEDNRGEREVKEWANFQNNFLPLIGSLFLDK